jgi:hypothetical protein
VVLDDDHLMAADPFRNAWPMTMPASPSCRDDKLRRGRHEASVLVGNEFPAILLETTEGRAMTTAQKRAVRSYRARLGKRGLARFEVLGRDSDRDLIRTLARRLAEDDADAARLRAAVTDTIADEPRKKGGIFAALRRSPLVGVGLDLARLRDSGRKVEL